MNMFGRGIAKESNTQYKQGFTLTEVLLVVAIIAIILTVSFPNIITMQRRLRQQELDDKAKIVFAAAQNQLIKMKSAGNTSILNSSEHIPSESFHYFANDDSSVSTSVMPSSVLEKSLDDNNWIVEFDPSTAFVKAVFYSEESDYCSTSDYSSNYSTYNQTYRNYNGRLSDGAKIGYYGE